MSQRPMLAAILLALCGATPQAQAQAPATAQVWDVRFVVDSSGPFAAGPTATQVGITMFARVGLLPNSSASGTNNFGILRVGGVDASAVLADSLAAAMNVSQGHAVHGRTSDVDGLALTDTAGEPLAGFFAPLRGAFSPQMPPLFLGSNSDPDNGVFSNPAIGSPMVSRLLGNRSANFGSDGSGPIGVATAVDSDPANLVGDLAPVFRMYFLPNPQVGTPRTITADLTGISARYIVLFVGFPQGSQPVAIPDQRVTFLVPGPVPAILLLGLACLLRRSRR